MTPYRVPVLAWVAAFGGLVFALLAEGPAADALATALVAAPLVLVARALRAARRAPAGKP